MNLTCQSEYGTLQRVFLKNSTDAFIDLANIAKQWKGLNFLGEPDILVAKNEYQQFEAMLRATGVEVNYFEADDSVTMDSLYCRDASIATDKGIIICRMGKAGRINEPLAAEKIYKKVT